jgi:hypothetical protein
MCDLEPYPNEYPNPPCPKCGSYIESREYIEKGYGLPERIVFYCDCGYKFETKTKDAE